MTSLKVDYKVNQTHLCELGQKYDTDKSSMRNDVNSIRHCHPYTIFYDSLFKNKKNEKLEIAELGILEGASLLMWNEYFTDANLYGFEYDYKLIKNFEDRYNTNRIKISHIDVTDKNSIQYAFDKVNIMYDIIVEDTTHQFEDQMRVIENIYKYLKPGGILIIEDIFKSYNEDDYINRLNPILEHFQDYYFVELDHCNRNSTGWDNDKLFILVKSGAEPIFKNNNKLTIITPSYRTDNLINVKNSINFDYVDEWIIVYDGSKIIENPNIFNNENNNKIKEYIHKEEGISGNPQRNYALSMIKNTDTFIYYLDDDNVIHPSLYKLLNIVDKNKMYSFNQEDGIKGNILKRNEVDTAMVLIDYKLCNNIKWLVNEYTADGYYIEECYNKNKESHIYINNDLCYYNKLSKSYEQLVKERQR